MGLLSMRHMLINDNSSYNTFNVKWGREYGILQQFYDE